MHLSDKPAYSHTHQKLVTIPTAACSAPWNTARDTMDVQTPSKYITLVSADGFEFVVLREAAMVSPIIKGMLDVRSR